MSLFWGVDFTSDIEMNKETTIKFINFKGYGFFDR